MNNILFSGGGFPFENKTIDFMQADYKTALTGLAGIGGIGDFIISGLVQTGANVGDGWIFFGGELLFFEGGVKADNFIIEEVTENKIYQDGQTHPAYVTRHAKFGTGVSEVAFSTLRRLPSLLEMQSLITSVIDFEPSIIISGCERTNISTSPTTMDIAAGLVMIDNNIIVTPGYSGLYPVWIDKDGQFVNAAPATGSFIKFDPHTSQEKASVIRRGTFTQGQILHSVVLNDRFDNTGLGRWEMKGFALMNGANGTLDKRGRVGVAYDGRGADPGGNVWDATYQAAGNTGGEKKHTILKAELPAVALQIQASDGTPIKSGADNSGTSDVHSVRNDVTESAGNVGFKTENMGSGNAMNILQPYLVEIHAQRI